MEKPWAWLHIKLCPHFLRLRPSFPSPPPQPLLPGTPHSLAAFFLAPPSASINSAPLCPLAFVFVFSVSHICISWVTLSAPRPFFQPWDLCHEKIHKSCDKVNLEQITHWVTVKFVCDESSVRRPTSKPYRGLFHVLLLSQMINHHLPRHNKLDGTIQPKQTSHENQSVQCNWPWGHRGCFKFCFCVEMFELYCASSILTGHFIRHTVQLLISTNLLLRRPHGINFALRHCWRDEDNFLKINASVTMWMVVGARQLAGVFPPTADLLGSTIPDTSVQ